MSFKYIQKSKSPLSEQTLRLLEAIDAFQYEVLNPQFRSLGDIHKRITVNVTDNRYLIDWNNEIPEYRMGDLRALLYKTESYNKEVETFNRFYGRKVGFRKTKVELRDLDLHLEWHRKSPDSYTTGYFCYSEMPGVVSQLGKKAEIELQYSKDCITFVVNYVHTMMKEFFESGSAKSLYYPWCIEVAIAEFATLRFLYAFYNANPTRKNAVMLKKAYYDVERKQYVIGNLNSALGAYMFLWAADIKWECLMRSARPYTDINSDEYKRLTKQICTPLPTEKEKAKTVNMLYQYLKDSLPQSVQDNVCVPLPIIPKLSAASKVIDTQSSLFGFKVGCLGEDLQKGDIDISVEHLPSGGIKVKYSFDMVFYNAEYWRMKEIQ